MNLIYKLAFVAVRIFSLYLFVLAIQRIVYLPAYGASISLLYFLPSVVYLFASILLWLVAPAFSNLLIRGSKVSTNDENSCINLGAISYLHCLGLGVALIGVLIVAEAVPVLIQFFATYVLNANSADFVDYQKFFAIQKYPQLIFITVKVLIGLCLIFFWCPIAKFILSLERKS